MDDFRKYLEQHKSDSRIVGIFSVHKADITAIEKLPSRVERRSALNLHYQNTKRGLIAWLEDNGGKVIDALPGTPELIVSGTYAFWQNVLLNMESKNAAFADVEGLGGNDAEVTL